MKTIVIGAGYHGCAIACHLAAAGVETLLIEKGEIGFGASGSNFGMVQLSDSELGTSLELNTRGFNRMMGFEEEFGRSIEYRRIGAICVAENDAEMDELQSDTAVKRDAGLDVRLLDTKEIEELEPNLRTDTIIGGTYFVQAQINPFLYLHTLISAGKRQGLQVMEHVRVASICESDGRCTGVRLEDGRTVESDFVVVSAGAWSTGLCSDIGVSIPVEYIIGECFVTEAVSPYLFNGLGSASFYTETHGTAGPATSFTTVQNQAGNLLLAETSDSGPENPDEARQLTSRQHCTGILDKVEHFLPGLKKINIIRNWTTCSPSTPRLEPVLGFTGPDGLLLATGFKSSVVISTVAGEIIRDLVTEGKTFCDLSQYQPPAN